MTRQPLIFLAAKHRSQRWSAHYKLHRVLLLDEPTAALDPASARAIEALLQHWFAQASDRHAWVWITHDPAQAARIGHRQWRVEAGRLSTEPTR